MKIRGNTVGTTQKPESVLVKSTAMTEEQKAQARLNIGASGQIVNTAEGNLVNMTDSAYAPVQGLTAYVSANTKGVNALALSVRGKNIANTNFRMGLLNGGKAYTDPSSKITLPYTSANEGTGLAIIIPCKAGVTYKFSANMALTKPNVVATVYNSVAEAKSYKNAVASYEDYTGTAEKGFTCKCGYDGIMVVNYCWKWSNGTTNAGTFPEGFVPYIAVESTLSEFEAPYGSDYTIALPETSYGGYVDFAGGKYVKTHTLDAETGEAIELETAVEQDIEDFPQVSTLYPLSNIFTDSGDVSVSYVADLKNYIDNKFNELATAMIANG